VWHLNDALHGSGRCRFRYGRAGTDVAIGELRISRYPTELKGVGGMVIQLAKHTQKY